MEISNVMNTCDALVTSENLPENIICGSGATVNLSYTFSVIKKIMRRKYSQKKKIQTDDKLVQPKISLSPRFHVNKQFCNNHSLSEFDNSIENAVVDYERFRKCL